MRAFIILGFLMATANAGLLGYNYGPGLSGPVIKNYGGSGLIGYGDAGNLISSGGSLIGSGGGLISTGGGLVSTGGGLISTGGGLISSGGGLIRTGGGLITNGGLISSGGLIGGGLLHGGSVLNSGSALGISPVSSYGGRRLINIGSLDSIPQTVEVSKQFFHFTAPDEIQEEDQITQQLSNVLKKNLQVVFIKAPENNAATNAALQLAKQAIEQKTSIYVLSKQNDGAQLVGQIQQIQENVPTTPEVRFIKYRTPQDLATAKNIIQSQYNNIEGTSEVIDGGVAPVLNYASQGSTLSGATLLGSGISRGIGSGLISTGGIGSGLISTGGIGSGLISTGGLGSGIISTGGLGSGIISTGSSGLGSGIVTDLGSTITKNIGGVSYGTSSSNYLPPSPLKK